MLLKLPTGRVILFRELQHGIDRFGEKGPHVCIDAAVLAEFGVEPLIEEILTSLGLSEQTVDWRNSSEAQEAAIDFVKRATAYKKRNE
jgi:hypothetical protein